MNDYYEDLIARLRTEEMSITLMHEAADALEEKIQTEKELRAALENRSLATVTIEADIDNIKGVIDEIGKLQKYKFYPEDRIVLVSVDEVLEILQAHITTKAV